MRHSKTPKKYWRGLTDQANQMFVRRRARPYIHAASKGGKHLSPGASAHPSQSILHGSIPAPALSFLLSWSSCMHRWRRCTHTWIHTYMHVNIHPHSYMRTWTTHAHRRSWMRPRNTGKKCPPALEMPSPRLRQWLRRPGCWNACSSNSETELPLCRSWAHVRHAPWLSFACHLSACSQCSVAELLLPRERIFTMLLSLPRELGCTSAHTQSSSERW